MQTCALIPARAVVTPSRPDAANRAADLRQILLSRPATGLRAGQSLFWQGDRSQSVFLVTAGTLRLSRLLVDGRRGVIGFPFAGEIIGLSAKGVHEYSAEAVTDVRVHSLPRERLYALASGAPHLHEDLLSVIRDEVSATQDQLITLCQKNAEERVASFLPLIAGKSGREVGGQIEVKVPMSRLDVADYLGLTVETVCRAITKLKRQNHITLIGRHTIILRRPAELARFAGNGGEGVGALPGEGRPAGAVRRALA